MNVDQLFLFVFSHKKKAYLFEEKLGVIGDRRGDAKIDLTAVFQPWE